jgi:transglutaminase-like putative cysteine protease
MTASNGAPPPFDPSFKMPSPPEPSGATSSDTAKPTGPTVRGRWRRFHTREEKLAYMQLYARRGARHPSVLQWARRFERLPPPARPAAILRFVQTDVRYERDPHWYDPQGKRHGIEVLESPAVVLLRGYGDCDAKASTFVALCLALGIEARMSPVFLGENGFPHVRAEVRVPRVDGRGLGPWQLADPTLIDSTIGHVQGFKRTALEPALREVAPEPPPPSSPPSRS